MSLITIQSHSHSYTVEDFPNLTAALSGLGEPGTFCLTDANVYELYPSAFDALPKESIYAIAASEPQKSFEELTPIFVWLLQNGLKRDGCLVIIGGGVVQDIGCFIASVLFRGVRWDLVPTTLLSQCDSCIGSKSSINIASYKNQIGTFYSPHRVLLTHDVLKTLPWDEVRSGMGEMIKLHLLAGEEQYRSLVKGIAPLLAAQDSASIETVLPRWIHSSLEIKKPYIEKDEFDQGVRNLLNYGHTFAHAYESATHYAIPHGIAVILGVLTATYLSAWLEMVPVSYFHQLREELRPWYEPYESHLNKVPLEDILKAIKLDKKSTKNAVNCILTRGAGRMEKLPVNMEETLRPALIDFLALMGR